MNTLTMVRSLAQRVRRAVFGADRDIALISDYLVGSLSAAEQSEVEHRLAAESGFAAKAEVLMEAWDHAPALALMPSGSRAQVVDEDLEAIEERAARVFYGLRDALGFPKRAYVGFPSGADRDRRRLANRWKTHSQWVTAAATLIFALWFGRIGLELHQARVVADRQGSEIIEHRASTGFLPEGEGALIETGAVETRDVVVKETAHVLLGPNSRAVLHDDALALDGSAVVVVPASAGYVVVHTFAMRAVLSPGRYAITAPPGQATLVTVDSGEAHVEPLAARGGDVVVRGGQKVSVSPTKAEIIKQLLTKRGEEP